MPDITIQSISTKLKWQGADPPKLRIFADVPFIVDDSVINPYPSPFFSEVDCTLDGGYVVVPDVVLPSTEDSSRPDATYMAKFFYANALGSSSEYKFGPFSEGFRVPVSPTPTTWGDIDANMGTSLGGTASDKTVTGDLIVGGDETVGGDLAVDGDLTVGGSGTFGGPVTATAFHGNGAALTGITGATGGVANTGSTTIGADTDANGVGKISLQTRNIARFEIESDGRLSSLMPYLGMKDPRDHGAKGDGATNDASAIQAAIAAAIALGGGEVFFCAGSFFSTSAIANNIGSSDMILRGRGGRTTLRPKTGGSGIGYQFTGEDSNESLTLQDLTFATQDSPTEPVPTSNENLVALKVSNARRVHLDRIDFIGLSSTAASAAIAAFAQTDAVLRDCSFNGCFTSAGNGGVILAFSAWRGVVVDGCLFQDFGSLNSVGFKDKTTLGNTLAWLYIGTPDSAHYSFRHQAEAIIRNCRFDEGGTRCIALVGDYSAGKPINAVKVEACSFNVGNIGNIGVYANCVENLVIEGCGFGYATVTQGNMLYMSDVRNVVIRNCNYDAATPDAGDIRISAATFVDTRLFIDNSVFHNLVVESGAGLVLDFSYGAYSYRGRHLIAGTYSFADLLPGPSMTAVKTGAYTMKPVDETVLCDPTAGTFAVTLPAANSVIAGVRVEIINVGSSNQATATAGGSDSIVDGSSSGATYAVTTGAPQVTFKSNGSDKWYVVAK
jgi:hypothetical protein